MALTEAPLAIRSPVPEDVSAKGSVRYTPGPGAYSSAPAPCWATAAAAARNAAELFVTPSGLAPNVSTRNRRVGAITAGGVCSWTRWCQQWYDSSRFIGKKKDLFLGREARGWCGCTRLDSCMQGFNSILATDQVCICSCSVEHTGQTQRQKSQQHGEWFDPWHRAQGVSDAASWMVTYHAHTHTHTPAHTGKHSSCVQFQNRKYLHHVLSLVTPFCYSSAKVPELSIHIYGRSNYDLYH